jgi:hypothetical protein
MSTNGGKALLDSVELVLTGNGVDPITVYVDIFDNSLSRKWLNALNVLVADKFHLEKNYCFFGFADSKRNGWYILDQVNQSIAAINSANLGYHIDDRFTMDNCMTDELVEGGRPVGRNIIHDKFNHLHRYFEDLQGVSGHMSEFYTRADNETRWHIRQLNLLCHEFESWALSYRKQIEAPDWQRPSQLMCWLHAPRFTLDEEDYELFGIDTINRSLGGVFVGVNKAVGKHHWEVFNDEGRDSRIDELTTSTLRSQTEAAGDFDIEWGRDPGEFEWQKRKLAEFKEWLVVNNFDPEDKSLTIGHPQIGQVDLKRSFASEDFNQILALLSPRLNVFSIKTTNAYTEYDYSWEDAEYMQTQIRELYK